MAPDEREIPGTGPPAERVINATGVVLHPDLGRAPLSLAAREALVRAAGYASVGYDLDTGRPAAPTAHVGARLARRCGTDAALVVTNAAGAVTLALAALAGGHETIISRGEVVEIGTLRISDAATAAGTQLVEVGSTNRTALEDYRAAITPQTALLVKVHRAGFTMTGATDEVDVARLAELGEGAQLPVLHVLGSGLLDEVADGPLAAEPSVAASLAAGTDLVAFSADLLLGGPPAGVLAGRTERVARLASHPFAHATGVDELRVAALEATLDAYERSETPADIPTVAMLSTPVDALQQRAAWVADQLGDAAAVAVAAPVGSGVLPGVELPSWAVAIPTADPGSVAATLRRLRPPVIVREDGDRVLLDLRTVPPAQDPELVELLLTASI